MISVLFNTWQFLSRDFKTQFLKNLKKKNQEVAPKTQELLNLKKQNPYKFLVEQLRSGDGWVAGRWQGKKGDNCT